MLQLILNSIRVPLANPGLPGDLLASNWVSMRSRIGREMPERPTFGRGVGWGTRLVAKAQEWRAAACCQAGQEKKGCKVKPTSLEVSSTPPRRVNLSHSPLPPSLLLQNERADTSISVYSGQRRTKGRRDTQTRRRSDANAPTFDDKEKLATQKSAAAPPLHTGGEKRIFFVFLSLFPGGNKVSQRFS